MDLKAEISRISNWYQIRAIRNEQKKQRTIKHQILSFHACPSDIDPTKDGYYVRVNKETWSQVIIIGKQSRANPMRQGYDEDFSDRAIDELIKIASTDSAALMYAHIMIPIDPANEASMLSRSFKQIAITQEQQRQGEQVTLNSQYNDLAGRDIKIHTRTVYKGRDHYYHFGFCAAVFGKSTEAVDGIMDIIKGKLDAAGIRYETPRFNQLGIIKSMLLTNYVDPKIMQPATGKTIARMMPLRNPNPKFPDQGIIVSVNADTHVPIRINPSKKDAGHTFIMAPTGSGKTVFVCVWGARALAHGDRVIVIEPKNEDFDGTDYRNFCDAFGGRLIRIGMDGQNFNPLQVFYDEKQMGPKQWSYQKAINDHYNTLISFFAAWIGPTFKNRMQGKFVESLIDLYKNHGIIDGNGNVINTEKWANGAIWPSIHELRQHWQRKEENKHDPSIDALIQNTMMAMPGGAYWWLANCKDSVDLNNDLLIFDISQLPDNIRNAISILIMGAVSTRYFPKPNDGSPRRRTYLFFDELGKLLQTPEMIPHIERGFKEARAAYITTVCCTQDPEIEEKVLKIIKANCSNIFLLSNLKEASIEDFEKVFCLNEIHRPRLIQKGTGIGIYIRDPTATNINIVLTEMERKALLQNEESEEFESAKVQAVSTFKIDPEVQWLKDEHGFICDNWCEGDKNFPGWAYYNVRDPFNNGSVNVWIEESLIIKAKDPKHTDKALNQGYKHYSTVCLIAGELCKLGFSDVKVNHYEDVDVSCYLIDEKGEKVAIGIEVEMPESNHSKVDFETKKRNALRTYNEVIFTCPDELKKEIKEAVGKDFVFPRGVNLKRKIEKCKVQNPGHFQALTEQTGTLENSK